MRCPARPPPPSPLGKLFLISFESFSEQLHLRTGDGGMRACARELNAACLPMHVRGRRLPSKKEARLGAGQAESHVGLAHVYMAGSLRSSGGYTYMWQTACGTAAKSRAGTAGSHPKSGWAQQVNTMPDGLRQQHALHRIALHGIRGTGGGGAPDPRTWGSLHRRPRARTQSGRPASRS